MDLLTPKDVDEILRYPSGRTARLARAGKLACIKLPDGCLRFSREAIDQLLRESERRPVARIESDPPGGACTKGGAHE